MSIQIIKYFSLIVTLFVVFLGVLETWWKKLVLMIAKKKRYLPAQTENKVKKHKQINYWLISGWYELELFSNNYSMKFNLSTGHFAFLFTFFRLL